MKLLSSKACPLMENLGLLNTNLRPKALLPPRILFIRSASDFLCTPRCRDYIEYLIVIS